MYHFVYKVLCNTTNRFYVGVHSTECIDDGYLGSGTALKNSLKKYGRSDHIREILKFFDSIEEAYLYERELVTQDMLKDPLCMNLALGGLGGVGHQGAGPRRMAELRQLDTEWAKMHSQALSQGIKKAHASGNYPNWGFQAINAKINSEKALSESSRKKRLDTFEKIGHAKGSKNSQYGTKWVSNEHETIKINSANLDSYLSKGYIRGRKWIVA